MQPTQPKPTPVPLHQRRNTLSKSGAPNGALYHPQMTLPSSYLTNPLVAPPVAAAAHPNAHMAGINQPPPNTNQRPYLAAEMGMMQEALKISALKAAETIRYMATVRRVGRASHVKGPPPAVANELRAQLARYDQLCDVVEARLVRAHAALSIRLARERAANPQLYAQKPTQIDSPMSDDVPLSISTNNPTSNSKAQYTPAPKTRGLASLASQHALNSAPDSAHIISPVTLASNAAIPSAQDSILSHHAVMPGLLEALRRQEQEQARSALHRPPGQDAPVMGIPIMEELFMADANPSGVDLDIDSAVAAAAIDASVGGMGHGVTDIESAIHSAVPDMSSAVAELDSAVAEMAAVGDESLFADLHTNPSGDNPDSFTGGDLQSRGFPVPDGDPFTSGNISASDFPNVSGTGEDSNKGDLLADLDATGSTGMDLEMDLMEIGGLGIAASEMGHTGENTAQDGQAGLGEDGMGLGGSVDLGIPDGELNMGDMDMGGDIMAMWGNVNSLDGLFGNTGADIGDDIQVKTEED
ncbi:hypothetical protein ACGC1H_001769 [Rhizoctonia solani]|uniref:Uncharacterized protein n=1 Tax=Rhizoctonia solani TaxID=456999 RepID=A0A8H2XC88_9AGAM|nr:unnamed protein product [Rhizoctonia solani]